MQYSKNGNLKRYRMESRSLSVREFDNVRRDVSVLAVDLPSKINKMKMIKFPQDIRCVISDATVHQTLTDLFDSLSAGPVLCTSASVE